MAGGNLHLSRLFSTNTLSINGTNIWLAEEVVLEQQYYDLHTKRVYRQVAVVTCRCAPPIDFIQLFLNMKGSISIRPCRALSL
jgi:hypothetical protein